MDSNKYMQDKYYTHDQFQSLILDKRPPGAEIKDIVDTFVKNGYTIEGVNAPEKPQETQQSGFLDRLKSEINSIAQKTGQKNQQAVDNYNQGNTNAFSTGANILSNEAAGFSQGLLAPINAGLQTAFQTDTFQNIANGPVGEVAQNVVGAYNNNVQPAVDKVGQIYDKNVPENTKESFRTSGNFLNTALNLEGGKAGASSIANTAAKTAGAVKQVGSSALSEAESLANGLTKLADSSSANKTEIINGLSQGMNGKDIAATILNRQIKLNPITGNKAFQDISGGQLPGQYLVEKGIYGTREEIVNGLAKDWVESYNLKKETLKQLPDQYTFNPVNEALKDLVAYEKKTSVAGAKGTFTDRINELANIAKTRGLTLSEIDDVKNIYENTVKLGYNKMINPEGVQRATNLDNAIRKFVEDKASTQGFTNVSELNKNTQLSRFLAQAIEDKIAGQSSNNFLSLTDTIIGSSAIIDPSGLVVLAGKKLLSSEKVQSALAKKLGGSAKSKLNANVLQAEPALLNPKSPTQPDFYVAPQGSTPGQFESANKKVILNGLKTSQGTPQAETQVVSQSLSKSTPQTKKKASVKTKKK